MRKIVITLLLVLCNAVASAQVYKWVDENGNTQYGDQPPHALGPNQSLEHEVTIANQSRLASLNLAKDDSYNYFIYVNINKKTLRNKQSNSTRLSKTKRAF